MAVESRPGDSGNSITMKIDIVDAGAADAGAADAGAVDAIVSTQESLYFHSSAEWKYTRLYSTIVNMNWHKFLSKKDLLSCKDHLPGDTLKLRAELTVSSLSFSLHF